MTSKFEVSVHVEGILKRLCEKHQVEYKRLYSNGGVTYGVRLTGDAKIISILKKKSEYPS